MPRELSLAIVGVDHPNKDKSDRRFEILLCAPGDPVAVEPEPRNPADSNAIAVFSERGIQIGYVTAERAPYIGGIIRSGTEVRAIFQEKTQWGAVIRVAFDGGAPTLPLPKPTEDRPLSIDQASPDDFYPDYIPPDDFD
jgi:hypothetical protein